MVMEDMLASGSDNEDIFGTGDAGQNPTNDALDGLLGSDDENAAPPAQSGGLDGMLAGSDNEDDLFGGPEPFDQPPAETGPSPALAEWERAKREEIAEIDAKNDEADAKMREEARERLNEFNKALEEGQAQRAKGNLELDEQKAASLEATGQKWEKVVSYIDFNRADLHERNVSRMKTLLLQLKH